MDIQQLRLRSKAGVMALGMLLFSTAGAFALQPVEVRADVNEKNASQQRGQTVTITVMDEMGPLIGANVTVKGTTIGNVADLDGKVVLQGVPADATLVVSYIGYVAQEIKLNNRTTLSVTLAEDTKTLEEVVVIGYGTLQKKQVTNAVSSISGEDMMVGVGGADITTAMQGKISGLIMYNKGSANSGSTIQLRGMTSINAGKDPLVVIDGFPGGDIRSVDQDDIKSIDVLKDASAGAIYGTRATSGVILITTKSGSNTNGKINMTYSNQFSIKQNYGAPDLLSAEEYRSHSISTDYGSNVDWWKEAINENNFSQRHNLSIESGSENAQIYFSVNYSQQDGITINDSREDYGGRFNANFKLFDQWLEVRPNVSYSQAARIDNIPEFQQIIRNNPTRSPYDPTSETGYNVWLNESMDYNTIADSRLRDQYGIDKWFKPEVTLKLNIKPVPGLTYQQVIGYENRQWEEHRYDFSTRRSERTESRKGEAYLGFSKTENLTSEGFFTYVKDFNGVHSINAVAGYSYFERNNEGFNMTNRNFAVDGIKYWDIGKGSYLSDGNAAMSSSKGVSQHLMSYLGRINYSYKDKYLFAASIRHEGSSKFAKANRWGDFWSLSGAWRISNESFMEGITWVNDLKVRVAYGVVGNNDMSSTYMADLLGSDTNWMMPNGTWAYSYGKTQNVNPNLKWEEKKELDFGLDYSLFNNRLYGKVDIFNRKTDDMIFSVKVPQPPYTQGDQQRNIGNMSIKGWEVEVGGDIIRTKDLTWRSNMNISASEGTINTLYGDNTYINGNGFVAPGTPGDASRIEEGSKIGSFYIWKFAGFDDDGGFLLYNQDGDIIPAKQKTEKDKQYIGSYAPKAIIGWNNTVTYKNWDLGISMRSWIDFDVYNTIDMYFGIQGVSNMNVLKSAYGKYNHIRGEKQVCDYYLQDGTFLKIDAITLGYTQPMRKYTKFIESIRIFGTIGDVCTITGYGGLNPEVNISGWNQGTERFWDRNLYPMVRTYTMGLRVKF